MARGSSQLFPDGSRHGQGLGWDGPVEVILPGTVNWANDSKTLAALIQDSAPIGKGPDGGGQLKTDLSLRRGGYKRLPQPQIGFEALIHNSYAFIQDQGGDVPERRPKGWVEASADGQQTLGDRAGQAMGWGGPRGGPHFHFAKRCKPFTIRGQNYIERGFDRWIQSRGHSATFGRGGLEIRWSEKQRGVA